MLVERHTRGIPQPGEHWRTFLHDNAMSFRRACWPIATVRGHAGTRPDGRRPARGSAAAPAATPGLRRTPAHALLAVSQYTVGAVLEQQAAQQDGAGA